MSLDPFAPLSARHRAALLSAYNLHLQRRNGDVDLASLRSSTRDAFFESVRAQRQSLTTRGDQARFAAHQGPGQLGDEQDPRTLWAICTANINLAEAYGVQRVIDAHVARTSHTDVERAYDTILVEEAYHTRMLCEAVSAVGLTMQVYRPQSWLRWVVDLLTSLPTPGKDFMTFMSEMCGIAGFRLLLAKARELFVDEPAALAVIERVYGEILLDELGHVHFLHARLSRPALWLAKQLTPLVMDSYLRGLPELVRLVGRDAIDAELRRVMSGEALALVDGQSHPVEAALAA